MCSFLFSTKLPNCELEELNFFLKFRGPDHTQAQIAGGFLFVHNLLSITGSFTPQPFHDGRVSLVFNGEIYNYREFGDYKSDGQCLIPLYKQYGPEFVRKLDGEFCLCLVDFDRKIAVISSDIFKTKPLFLALGRQGLACASYRTPLLKLGFDRVESAEPNTALVISLERLEVIQKFELKTFDLNQHKMTYDDWVAAFSAGVRKRVENLEKKVFIGLSSGYDSGIIFNELLKLGKPFKTFSLRGSENESILDSRIAMAEGRDICHSIQKNPEQYKISHDIISERVEDFKYTIHSDSSDYNERATSLTDDYGSNNFATVCTAARRLDCTVCLSGTGADEIISDYGFNGIKIFPHSNFGGLFPADLGTIFPWASFFGSTLESYIAKEEYVGGAFGIEMRYPFLDSAVVQEFLWLHQDLKNREYKSVIDYYFKASGFPYAKHEKRGF
jgi:asparagine synthetase B (glutamine-hydrolysing)